MAQEEALTTFFTLLSLAAIRTFKVPVTLTSWDSCGVIDTAGDAGDSGKVEDIIDVFEIAFAATAGR